MNSIIRVFKGKRLSKLAALKKIKKYNRVDLEIVIPHIKNNIVGNIFKTGDYYFEVVEISNTEDTLHAIGYWADLSRYYPTIEKAIDTLSNLPDLKIVTDIKELNEIKQRSLYN